MPGTRRTPISRSPLPVITPESVRLFECGIRLQRRRRTEEVEGAIRDVSNALALELKFKPWNDCPLTDCDCKEPPSFLTGEFEIADWWRSRWIREQLQDALRDRRRAEREARKVAAAVPKQTPDQPPPG